MRCLKAAAEILALIFLIGCVAAPTIERKREVRSEPEIELEEIKPVEKNVTPPLIAEDFDLLSEGIALLGRPDHPDPTKARSVFASLAQLYPRSRWRSTAESFIRLIDEAEVSRKDNRKAHLLLEKAVMEQNRLLQENDHLRMKIHDLKETLQVETTSLIQENEKLKKDLQRLKLLEIELQKRERMLR